MKFLSLFMNTKEKLMYNACKHFVVQQLNHFAIIIAALVIMHVLIIKTYF